MSDYCQADLDEARQLAPELHAKAQERIARALARRERLGSGLDLTELQRLCDRATRGPWRIDEDGDLRAGGEAPFGLCTLAVLRAPCPVVDNSCGVNEVDVAFIAAARDALPKLIARVRQLQAQVENADALREYADKRCLILAERLKEVEHAG